MQAFKRIIYFVLLSSFLFQLFSQGFLASAERSKVKISNMTEGEEDSEESKEDNNDKEDSEKEFTGSGFSFVVLETICSFHLFSLVNYSDPNLSIITPPPDKA